MAKAIQMTRPSSNLDKKMLKAGKKIVSKEGSEGLSIPKICSIAKANLGMFNYHFGTKENYISILYSGFKEEITKFLGIDEMGNKNPIEKIRLVTEKFALYISTNPHLARSIFFDGLSNGTKFGDYIERGIIPRYDHLIIPIEEAQKEGYLRKDIPTAEIFACITFGVLGPEIFKVATCDIERIYKFEGPQAKDFTVGNRLDIILENFLLKK